MAEWNEIAMGNLKAAQLLGDAGQFRSGVSRAYYAAFSAVAYALRAHAPFGSGRETPPHHAVIGLMHKHLAHGRSAARLRAMKAMIRRLYTDRISADYKAGATVDVQLALRSRMDAHRVCKELKVFHASSN